MEKINIPIKFYVINLRRATGRSAYIKELFDLKDLSLDHKIDIKYQIVEAVDGADNVDKFCAVPHKIDPTDRSCTHMTKYVLATTISHFKAIKTFAEDTNNCDEYAIITEDDVAFDFCTYWNFTLDELIKNAPNDWQIIQLVYGKSLSKASKFKTLFTFIKGYGYSATAYLIKKSKAIEYTEKFFKDDIFQNTNPKQRYIADYIIYDNAITYTHVPSLLTYRNNNDSYIHPEHLPNHVKLKKENDDLWKKRLLDL
jgi:GR25 family glycosyltransferase involved in LPS biosynthesis